MRHKFNTFVTITTLSAIMLHIMNKMNNSISTIKNKLQYSENHYYEWRFGKVRYTKTGNGTPLLLIHDLIPGSSQYEFHNIIHELSKTHEVFALDLLGYGLSDRPNITYTNFLYVELINDFIKKNICKKTDIVATGDSSSIAIMACHNDPNLINKMVFINPQSLYQLNSIPSKQTRILKFILEIPIIGTFVYNTITSKEHIIQDFKEKYYYNTSLISEDDIDTYLESAHLLDSSSRFSYASYIGKYTNANIIHALKEINNAVYLICGKEKNDIDTIVKNYEYYNLSIESCYINHTKHLPHLEQPDEVLKQLSLFIN